MADREWREITAERKMQEETWGEQNHSDERWLVILSEEVGEAAQSILHGNSVNLEYEITQIAAVAIAWLESRRRQQGTNV